MYNNLNMKLDKFLKLTSEQQISLITAIHLRNEMEDFHVANLSDKQMKELNKIIRQALFEISKLYSQLLNKPVNKETGDTFQFLVESIPDYWEIPEKNIYRSINKIRH